MQTEVERIPLTYEDYALIPDDGRRHEIIDGDEVVSPSPRSKHRRVVGRRFAGLDRHVRKHRLGEVFVAPFDVVLSDHDIVQPDVLFVSDARLAIVDEENCKGAPDFVAEVLPSPRRGRGGGEGRGGLYRPCRIPVHPWRRDTLHGVPTGAPAGGRCTAHATRGY